MSGTSRNAPSAVVDLVTSPPGVGTAASSGHDAILLTIVNDNNNDRISECNDRTSRNSSTFKNGTSKDSPPSIWMRRAELETYFTKRGGDGRQIRIYFGFLNFLQINNLVMCAWCLLGWIPHVVNTYNRMELEGMPMSGLGRTTVSDLLFLSTYQPSSDNYWAAMVVLGTFTMFLTPLIYYYGGIGKILVTDSMISQTEVTDSKVSTSAQTDDFEETEENKDDPGDEPDSEKAEEISQTEATDSKISTSSQTDQPDLIQENKNCTTRQRYALKIVSYGIFVLVCGIPAGINYALMFALNLKSLKSAYETYAGNYNTTVTDTTDESSSSTTSIAVIVVIIKAINDIVFELIASILTNMEKHKYWSHYRYHRLFKLAIFRLTNTMSIFIIRFYADAPFYPCQTGRIAFQAFVLIFLELTLNNVWEITYSALFTYVYPWFQSPKGNGDKTKGELESDHRLDVELTDDYLELIYRQYLMLAFLAVFPLVCLFTLLCNLIEWPLDKYRMIHLSNPVIKGSFKSFRGILAGFCLGAAVCSLLHFPSGPVWFAPPVGPFLCWPCAMFSQATTAGGTCLPNFEPAQCQDHTGSIIGQDVIQSKIADLIAQNSQAQQARAWFDENDHLFSSRRCSCRPCHLAISCRCDQPPVQQFGSTSQDRVPMSAYSYQQWSQRHNTTRNGNCGLPVSKECWTCPEAFYEFTDPLTSLNNWRKLYFCERCTWSPCVCKADAPGCSPRLEEIWHIKKEYLNGGGS